MADEDVEDLPPVEGNDPDGNTPDGNTPDGNDPDGNAPDGNDPDGNNAGDKTGDDGEYSEFTLPEGVELDAAALEVYTPAFKELGLTQEQAQKLVDLRAKEVQAAAESQSDAFAQLLETWKTETTNDKELGGDRFEKNLGVATEAINKFGTPELRTLLDETGVGNHVEMFRFMVKVGQLTKEDVPGAPGRQTSPEASRVELLYPNS